MKAREISEIAIIAAVITIMGAIKIPSIMPGMEFQLSAPFAVAVCAVFGFKKYIIAGVLSSMISLMLGTHTIFNVAIAMEFRIVAGLIVTLAQGRMPLIMIAGPLGTLAARLTLSVVLGKAALALAAAAVPGMIFTFIATPFFVKLVDRIQLMRRVRAGVDAPVQ